MRYALVLGLAVAAFGASFGCGGSDKPADHPTETSDAGAAPASSTPTTTTTILSGDAGELQGSKLTTSSGAALDGGANSTPRPNANDRDPGRSQADLITIIQSHRAEARACYDAALKTNPSLNGNLDITWKLDPNGNVTETGEDDSKSDIHDAGVVKCISDVLRSIKWAASPRGFETRAHYPFNFHPHGTGH